MLSSSNGRAAQTQTQVFEKPVPDGWPPTNRRSSPLVPGAARAFGVSLIIRPVVAAPAFRYVPCRLPA